MGNNTGIISCPPSTKPPIKTIELPQTEVIAAARRNRNKQRGKSIPRLKLWFTSAVGPFLQKKKKRMKAQG